MHAAAASHRLPAHAPSHRPSARRPRPAAGRGGPAAPAAEAYAVRRHVVVAPRFPYALPAGPRASDGLVQVAGGRWRRLFRSAHGPVCVAARQPAPATVELCAAGPSEEACEYGLARARHVLGVDDDLLPFHRAFRDDRVIGPALRRHPRWRPVRRADAWESLLFAIPEQLITYEEAAVIQRAILRRAGARCAVTGLPLPPDCTDVAALAVADLQACGLTEARARALYTCARHLGTGRLSLDGPDWAQRLSRYPGIGDWTCEIVGLMGLGRHDLVPARDDGLMKAVGRLLTGIPTRRASEHEVRDYMCRYGRWAGLASLWLMRGPVRIDAVARPQAAASAA